MKDALSNIMPRNRWESQQTIRKNQSFIKTMAREDFRPLPQAWRNVLPFAKAIGSAQSRRRKVKVSGRII